MAPPRRYSDFQLEVFREGAAAGLTQREAARYAGIKPGYASILAHNLCIRWTAAHMAPYEFAVWRINATMRAVAAQLLVHRLARLAAERRLFQT